MAKQTASNSEASSHQNYNPAPVTIVKQPMKVLYAWKSTARPFKKHDREFFTTAGSIIFLVCVILVFLKEFLLIMAIISLAFFVYILSTVKPEEVEHKITTKGIKTGNKNYLWNQLGRFWFASQWDSQLLYVENYLGLPTRLMMVINKDKQKIKNLLEPHLLYEKPEKTQIEKAGEWLQKKIPLETSPSAGISTNPKSSGK